MFITYLMQCQLIFHFRAFAVILIHLNIYFLLTGGFQYRVAKDNFIKKYQTLFTICR